MQYLRLMPPGLVLASFVLVLAATGVGARRHIVRGASRREAFVRAGLLALALAGALFTLTITLVPAGAAAPARYVSFDVAGQLSRQFADFPSQTAVLQFAINVFLVSWLGLLLPLLWTRIGVVGATLACASAALLIETMQFLLPTGRAATLTDVVLNTVGGLIGALVAVHVLRPRVDDWVSPGAVLTAK